MCTEMAVWATIVACTLWLVARFFYRASLCIHYAEAAGTINTNIRIKNEVKHYNELRRKLKSRYDLSASVNL